MEIKPMPAPFIRKVSGITGGDLDACRPLDNHSLRAVFRDRWLAANPDLTESDICRIEAKGLQVKAAWMNHFHKKQEERRNAA